MSECVKSEMPENDGPQGERMSDIGHTSHAPRTVRELMDRDIDWLRTLTEVYKIKATRDGDLVSLKYDQHESPMHEPMVAQCRGMVVDVERGVILAHPYDKFWNHGELHAAEIDWARARVQEKLDGSLMILWWSPFDLVWHVSSSGHPTAGGEFGYDTTRTFADAFWDTFQSLGMKLPAGCTGSTFMFEICAKQNRIVVKHDAPRLVLHGARATAAGVEWSRSALEHVAGDLGWEIVKEYPIDSLAACLALVEELDPIKHEGFVVVDDAFRRIKIKSSAYVALHHLRGEGMSQRRAIELWQKGETAEVLASFPEYTDETEVVRVQLDAAIAQSFALWNDHRTLPTKKDFAMAVKSSPLSGIAFKLWALELERTPKMLALEDASEIVRGLHVSAIQRLIESVLFGVRTDPGSR